MASFSTALNNISLPNVTTSDVTTPFVSPSSVSAAHDVTSFNTKSYNLSSNDTTMASAVISVTSSLQEAEKYLWLIFAPIIVFLGIFGNVLNVLILIKMKFYKNSTLFLLFILAFADMTVLIVGPPRYFFKYLEDFDLRTVSQFSCKLSLFLIYFSMQFSSWILVLVTVIRYIKTVFPMGFDKFHFSINVKKGAMAAGIIAALLFFLNFHFFFTNGVTEEGDCSSLTPEYNYFDEYVFVYIDFVFLSVLPAIIIVVLNFFIIRDVRRLKTRRRDSINRRPSVSSVQERKQYEPISKVTKMLVVTSTYFIAASVPISIYFIVDSYWYSRLDEQGQIKMDMAWTISYLIQFSNFALNFYLYTATNERFRKELRKIFRKVKERVRKKLHPKGDYELSSTSEHQRKISRSVTISS